MDWTVIIDCFAALWTIFMIVNLGNILFDEGGRNNFF